MSGIIFKKLKNVWDSSYHIKSIIVYNIIYTLKWHMFESRAIIKIYPEINQILCRVSLYSRKTGRHAHN